MKKNIIKITAFLLAALSLGGVGGGLLTSCSDGHMEELNTDKTKSTHIDPNTQLTTALLQTYGDFDIMDTYRNYITGFTQHMAGGWNVTNFAGCNNFDGTIGTLWDKFYTVGIKNLVDGIYNSAQKPNINAALRIQKVYMMSILTDAYGDIPCSEAGLGYLEGKGNPKYDTQEEIYDYFFSELEACVAQLGTGTDRISGDVTNLGGDITAWKKFANSLRMRFAMRISDVNPTKAEEEFLKAISADGGYITEAKSDAYVKYLDVPFTLYDGAKELDFRANALGETFYGQSAESPTMICATFFNMMQSMQDPRLYRICRHYNNVKRSQIKPDEEWNVDVTDEFLAYLQKYNRQEVPCGVGDAWYQPWLNDVPTPDDLPTMAKLLEQYPDGGFFKNNYDYRMARPWLSIQFEQPDRPGFLISSAEVKFLLAEAKSKGWDVPGDMQALFEDGIRDAMQMLNTHYLSDDLKISDSEIETYISYIQSTGALNANACEAINTQAYILHLMNPSEAWANLRRSDYPVLEDRSKKEKYSSQFTYPDEDMSTPDRLYYSSSEKDNNTAMRQEALDRMGGEESWHSRVWWDVKHGHFE